MNNQNGAKVADGQIESLNISQGILRRRYLLMDSKGSIFETVAQIYTCVAKTIAEVEARYGVSEQEIRQIS